MMSLMNECDTVVRVAWVYLWHRRKSWLSANQPSAVRRLVLCCAHFSLYSAHAALLCRSSSAYYFFLVGCTKICHYTKFSTVVTNRLSWLLGLFGFTRSWGHKWMLEKSASRKINQKEWKLKCWETQDGYWCVRDFVLGWTYSQEDLVYMFCTVVLQLRYACPSTGWNNVEM